MATTMLATRKDSKLELSNDPVDVEEDHEFQEGIVYIGDSPVNVVNKKGLHIDTDVTWLRSSQSSYGTNSAADVTILSTTSTERTHVNENIQYPGTEQDIISDKALHLQQCAKDLDVLPYGTSPADSFLTACDVLDEYGAPVVEELQSSIKTHGIMIASAEQDASLPDAVNVDSMPVTLTRRHSDHKRNRHAPLVDPAPEETTAIASELDMEQEELLLPDDSVIHAAIFAKDQTPLLPVHLLRKDSEHVEASRPPSNTDIENDSAKEDATNFSTTDPAAKKLAAASTVENADHIDKVDKGIQTAQTESSLLTARTYMAHLSVDSRFTTMELNIPNESPPELPNRTPLQNDTKPELYEVTGYNKYVLPSLPRIPLEIPFLDSDAWLENYAPNRDSPQPLTPTRESCPSTVTPVEVLLEEALWTARNWVAVAEGASAPAAGGTTLSQSHRHSTIPRDFKYGEEQQQKANRKTLINWGKIKRVFSAPVRWLKQNSVRNVARVADDDGPRQKRESVAPVRPLTRLRANGRGNSGVSPIERIFSIRRGKTETGGEDTDGGWKTLWIRRKNSHLPRWWVTNNISVDSFGQASVGNVSVRDLTPEAAVEYARSVHRFSELKGSVLRLAEPSSDVEDSDDCAYSKLSTPRPSVSTSRHRAALESFTSLELRELYGDIVVNDMGFDAFIGKWVLGA
ncbi:uncharacterized protein SPPG_02856 [Spizellomyces punctatus DAOM BR117]|uniref:Uncharacterized protein n=1 Tax=Spizellomyces punctatus (strain DAOM BR117) TaxID=645134 RepID=A0A0L0HMR3_SPIPD|nr:uncharacterized protein SPPG_02856 [Spizellomyces punctatus DAOM BR117]KND02387.1 hypothetical protein SPPG_02856 [Spizellomyces punctatus DAOM BR117]|eukprot:XP_016610426.1 hypothetical protein SPPG_02856 [Spizellomyces punctatus DAOM BR117]